ncbi:hypothetical protein BgiBS90_021638 [Biomphalaria glabrata]|nr:hypothetical protein BgiBS90_021638 [Biomphalaria glabrata]
MPSLGFLFCSSIPNIQYRYAFTWLSILFINPQHTVSVCLHLAFYSVHQSPTYSIGMPSLGFLFCSSIPNIQYRYAFTWLSILFINSQHTVSVCLHLAFYSVHQSPTYSIGMPSLGFLFCSSIPNIQYRYAFTWLSILFINPQHTVSVCLHLAFYSVHQSPTYSIGMPSLGFLFCSSIPNIQYRYAFTWLSILFINPQHTVSVCLHLAFYSVHQSPTYSIGMPSLGFLFCSSIPNIQYRYAFTWLSILFINPQHTVSVCLHLAFYSVHQSPTYSIGMPSLGFLFCSSIPNIQYRCAFTWLSILFINPQHTVSVCLHLAFYSVHQSPTYSISMPSLGFLFCSSIPNIQYRYAFTWLSILFINPQHTVSVCLHLAFYSVHQSPTYSISMPSLGFLFCSSIPNIQYRYAFTWFSILFINPQHTVSVCLHLAFYSVHQSPTYSIGMPSLGFLFCSSIPNIQYRYAFTWLSILFINPQHTVSVCLHLAFYSVHQSPTYSISMPSLGFLFCSSIPNIQYQYAFTWLSILFINPQHTVSVCLHLAFYSVHQSPTYSISMPSLGFLFCSSIPNIQYRYAFTWLSILFINPQHTVSVCLHLAFYSVHQSPTYSIGMPSLGFLFCSSIPNIQYRCAFTWLSILFINPQHTVSVCLHLAFYSVHQSPTYSISMPSLGFLFCSSIPNIQYRCAFTWLSILFINPQHTVSVCLHLAFYSVHQSPTYSIGMPSLGFLFCSSIPNIQYRYAFTWLSILFINPQHTVSVCLHLAFYSVHQSPTYSIGMPSLGFLFCSSIPNIQYQYAFTWLSILFINPQHTVSVCLHLAFYSVHQSPTYSISMPSLGFLFCSSIPNIQYQYAFTWLSILFINPQHTVSVCLHLAFYSVHQSPTYSIGVPSLGFLFCSSIPNMQYRYAFTWLSILFINPQHTVSVCLHLAFHSVHQSPTYSISMPSLGFLFCSSIPNIQYQYAFTWLSILFINPQHTVSVCLHLAFYSVHQSPTYSIGMPSLGFLFCSSIPNIQYRYAFNWLSILFINPQHTVSVCLHLAFYSVHQSPTYSIGVPSLGFLFCSSIPNIQYRYAFTWLSILFINPQHTVSVCLHLAFYSVHQSPTYSIGVPSLGFLFCSSIPNIQYQYAFTWLSILFINPQHTVSVCLHLAFYSVHQSPTYSIGMPSLGFLFCSSIPSIQYRYAFTWLSILFINPQHTVSVCLHLAFYSVHQSPTYSIGMPSLGFPFCSSR